MKQRYHAIDIMKFVCSIMVIVVHTSPLLPYSEFGNFVLINILGRFAVPFFFISSGYFVSMKARKDPSYFRKYIRSLIKLYCLWSILYLPFGFQWLQANIDIPFYLYPVALVLGFFYLGTYYHLWYMPALIFSLIFMQWISKRVRHRTLMPILFLLFCVGALETYYGVVNIPQIHMVIDNYMAVFFTTRNGLFFGLFFVGCGYYLSKTNRSIHVKNKQIWLVACIIGLVVEAYLLNKTETLNFNFLIMLAPCTIFLFLFLRDFNVTCKLNYAKMRAYGEYYYFSHAFFLVLIPEGLSLLGKREVFDEHGVFRFLSVLLCTHMVSWCIYTFKKRKITKEELTIKKSSTN